MPEKPDCGLRLSDEDGRWSWWAAVPIILLIAIICWIIVLTVVRLTIGVL